MTDKRVDRMLRKRGYENSDVYYSPISAWLIVFLYLFVLLFPLPIFVLHWSLIFVYSGLSYLAAAYTHTSFALTEEELIVINPNFPFRRCTSYELHTVEKITIEHAKPRFYSYVFSLLENKYVQIKANGTSKRYYCAGLEQDSWEATTDKTIDEFANSLRRKKVKVEYKLDE